MTPPPGALVEAATGERGAGRVPEWGYAAALAGLAFMSWDRLAPLLAGRRPSQAWDHVRRGGAGPAWAREAGAIAVEAVASAHGAAGVRVDVHGTPGYPPALAADHEAPPVVFSLGSLSALGTRRVGIVGTRRATGYGRDVARQLGRDLAAAGVTVVSGLALGIDGASHEGAVAVGGPPPVAVVGSGLDVVYPRRHAALWGRVAREGVLLSEAPVGSRPEPWRFPARNRLIAALCEVVVVVESHLAGGSLHTVRAAEERGRTVMAVPGPVCSPASAGTNRLLSEGCAPACDATDVLVALALEAAAAPRPADERPPPSPSDAAVLDALGWSPVSLDELMGRTGLAAGALALALEHLERDGWARGEGGWWERVGTP